MQMLTVARKSNEAGTSLSHDRQGVVVSLLARNASPWRLPAYRLLTRAAPKRRFSVHWSRDREGAVRRPTIAASLFSGQPCYRSRPVGTNTPVCPSRRQAAAAQTTFEPGSRGFPGPWLGQPFYGWYRARRHPAGSFRRSSARSGGRAGSWGGDVACRLWRHASSPWP